MTALAAERDTVQMGNDPIPRTKSYPVKASTKIYKGSLVVMEQSSGWAKPGTAALGLVALGRAKATVDNSSGANGDKTVEVELGVFKWANSAAGDAIAKTEIGKACFIVDDQTVAKTSNSGARSEAGTVEQVDSDGVWVRSIMEQGAGADSVTAADIQTTAFKLRDFTGRIGAGAITLTGAKVGDVVMGVADVTNGAGSDQSANFEAVITVADQIQQSSAANLSAVKFAVILLKRG